MNRLVISLLLLAFAACSASGVEFDPAGPPAKKLSQYNLFDWDPATGTFDYNEGVIPYEMNTELFTDYALKARAIYLPEGESGAFDPKDAFDFPVGTLILKNFYFPADFREPTEGLRLVETRLYVHTPSGWEGRPYIWDAEGKDAEYSPGGEVRSVSFIDEAGETRVATHLIPQQNQCQQCHILKDPATGLNYQTIIGPKARYLNRVHDYGGEVGERNQLEYLAELGLLTGVPSDLEEVEQAFDFREIAGVGHEGLEPDALDKAARDYLDINCAHCHNPNGIQGISSNLFLNYDNHDDFTLGICKPPGSAGQGAGGLEYDIVPGYPELSILNFRIETLVPGALMPLLGRSLEHVEATSLIAEWVRNMPEASCTP
jgi:uncharacterized repeat protein (TIGR03806 family)